MKEKYPLTIGAGLIVVSFVIMVSFVILGVENPEENGTPTFEQLREIEFSRQEILNNTPVQQFKKIVGDLAEEIQKKITVDSSDTVSSDG